MAGASSLILARHGETPFNASRRFCGRSDPPLSPRGTAQAQTLAERWRDQVDEVLSSPARRAVQTASQLASPRTHPGLWELDQGELEGMTFDDALGRHPEFFERWREDPWTVEVPGGERLVDAVARVRRTLAEIAAEARGQRILVVGHQMVFAGLACELAGDAPRAWQKHTLPNAGWIEVRVDAPNPAAWRVIARSDGRADQLAGM